jgi:hypothetical protein
MASRIAHHLRNHSVAYLALFLALSAGSFAATKKKKVKVPPNSIGTQKLKDKAVKEKKIAAGSVTREKLDVKIPVAEAVGNITYTSATPTAATGTAGVAAVTESSSGQGFVCIDAAAKVTTAVGTAQGGPDPGAFVTTTVPAGATCPAAADILVTVRNGDTGVPLRNSFSILAF